MSFTRTQLIILGSVGVVILGIILLVVGIIPGLKTAVPTKVELTYWGLRSDEQAMKDVIARYSQVNNNVTIKYTGIPEEQYEETLIDSLAAGTGPDIFLLRNDWVQKHKNKIFSAPSELVSGSTVTELFPSVVGSDLLEDGAVYGLPLSIDTLALIYNRSIFDAKQIAVPPVTWDGIRGIVSDLRELRSGTLEQGAIALGETNESVFNSDDILTLLMIQNGVDIYNESSNRVTISNANGLSALNLYTDFAYRNSPAYAWDASLGNSINAFAEGNVAMGIFYHKQIRSLRERNPILSIGVLPFPQTDQNNPVNFAEYWSMVVSKNTSNYATSWDFINFATTNVSAASAYLASSGNPPALRSLIADNRQNADLRVFVGQSLTARSWPVPDHARVSKIINDMIESALINKASNDKLQNILKTAESEINRLIR